MSVKEKVRVPAYANAQWQRHYGVGFDPFGAEGECFYIGSWRQEVLDNLRHLVHFSDHILVVAGDKGSGKTYLLNQLKEYEKDALRITWIKPGLLEGRVSLVVQIARQMGVAVVKGETIDAIIVRILDTCASRFSHGLRSLIIIDDAHELSDESLELLVKRFDPRHSGAFGLVLLAQQQMASQIRRLFHASEVQPFHQLQLRNFSAEDTVQYVKLRLSSSGWSGVPEIPASAFEQIHRLGKGLPGRINRIASTVLLSSTEKRPAQAVRPRKLIVVFSGLVATALALAVLLIGMKYTDDSVESPQDTELEQVRYTVNLPDSNANSEQLLKEGVGSEAVVNNEVVPMSGRLESDTEVASQSDTISNDEEKEVEIGIVSGSTAEVLSEKSTSQEGPTNAVVNGKNEEAPVVQDSAEQVDDKDGSKMVRRPQDLVRNELAEKPVAAVVEEAVARPEAVTEPTKEAADKAAIPRRTLSWVRSQPSGSWTIQVLGSLSEETAHSFLGMGLDKKDYFYVKSSYQGQDWYVVLHGVYSNKEAARAALTSLPAEIRDAGAWIRSLTGVQADSDK